MKTDSRCRACWAISDGAAGNERQAVALAEALALTPTIVRIRLREPWNMLSPRLIRGSRAAIRDVNGRPLSPPWPDIAIGCGRRAALVTRGLRDWSGGRCFTVQILDPRVASGQFDVVVVPQHDRVAGSNVLQTIGALNGIDQRSLGSARIHFAALADLPSPRTAVLIGGSTRSQRLDERYFDALVDRLSARQQNEGGSFLVSVSRRTPASTNAGLRAAFARFPGLFWSGADAGDNPYAGFLAWADRIVVTPDSVNMISEACATGKPVYTFAPRPIAGKLAEFHAELVASGHLRRLDDHTHLPQPAPLTETAEIAELVRQRWRVFRGD